MKALELSGQIDEKHGLHVDQPIPIDGPCRVRVLLLIPEGEELPEDEWRRRRSEPGVRISKRSR